MRTLQHTAALGAIALLATAGASALTASAVTAAANASARISCRREAALALISADHCATRKAGATSTAWSF